MMHLNGIEYEHVDGRTWYTCAGCHLYVDKACTHPRHKQKGAGKGSTCQIGKIWKRVKKAKAVKS